MPDVTDLQITSFQRFLSALPHGKDTELVLLKGHLLIEEQIRLLIHRRLRNPDTLYEPNSRLETHQAIQLARAFFPPDHLPEIWKGVLKVNKLRNDIAHNLLTKSSLADKIEAWVRALPSGFESVTDPRLRFEYTLHSLFEAVSALVDAPSAEVIQLDNAQNGTNAV